MKNSLTLFDAFDDILNDFYKGYTYPMFKTVDTFPFFTNYKEGEDLKIEAALPGFVKDDLDISVENGILTIKSSTKQEETKKNYKLFYKSSFVKRYILPDEL